MQNLTGGSCSSNSRKEVWSVSGAGKHRLSSALLSIICVQEGAQPSSTVDSDEHLTWTFYTSCECPADHNMEPNNARQAARVGLSKTGAKQEQKMEFDFSTKPVTGRNKEEWLNMQRLLQSKPDGEKLTKSRMCFIVCIVWLSFWCTKCKQKPKSPTSHYLCSTPWTPENRPVEGNKPKQKNMSTHIFIELGETWAQVEYGWQVSTNITSSFDGVTSCWTLDEETERCKMWLSVTPVILHTYTRINSVLQSTYLGI